MKVTVCLAELDDALEARIESFLHDNWPRVAIYNSERNMTAKQRGDNEATLTVTNRGNVRPKPRTTLNETVIVNEEPEEELLYLVNAKLGKLTGSEIPRPNPTLSLESPLSRREFLIGMFGRPKATANADYDVPFVSIDSCEARFGCRKCIETCPAGALEVREKILVVSKEDCVRCGLCIGICPVAAIQAPEMPENAYRGLLGAIQHWPSPKKTLVITCCKEKTPKTSWVDVEQVHGIGIVGVRQLAMAASTSINATIIYCPDGLCVGKEHVKRAVDLIRSITKASPPSVYYLEGSKGAAEIEHIHNSAKKGEDSVELTANPWKSYVTAIENISTKSSQATGLGFTDIQIAESCTLCNACVDKCPHMALRIENGELLFNFGECTGCGYCRQICPEQAVTLLERNGSIEFTEKSVYRDEMVRCSTCNTPYASAKMARKISAALQTNSVITTCPACRKMQAYETLFSITSPKTVN